MPVRVDGLTNSPLPRLFTISRTQSLLVSYCAYKSTQESGYEIDHLLENSGNCGWNVTFLGFIQLENSQNIRSSEKVVLFFRLECFEWISLHLHTWFGLAINYYIVTSSLLCRRDRLTSTCKVSENKTNQ